jgi:hypothetical protein
MIKEFLSNIRLPPTEGEAGVDPGRIFGTMAIASRGAAGIHVLGESGRDALQPPWSRPFNN